MLLQYPRHVALIHPSMSQLLKGDDVVGSTVTITVQKHNSKNTVSVRLVRAAAERIRAIGQLFLQLSEICSDCYHHKLPTVRDIEEAEEQARVINKLTAKHMEAHVAHIEELEAALARAERVSGGDCDGGGGEAQDLRKCLERAEDQVKYSLGASKSLIRCIGSLVHDSKWSRSLDCLSI